MLDTVFTALADPTRRAIVEQLVAGPATVSALAFPHQMTLPAVLKHLAVLEQGGLLVRAKSGRTVTCTLRPGGIRHASDYLNSYRQLWSGALDRIAALVERETP